MRDQFDLLMLTSSWDRRSICIAHAADIRSNYSTLLLFDKRDRVGLRDNHDRVLLEFCNSHAQITKEIKGRSSDISNVWSQLLQAIHNVKKEIGKPLKVCIDISACPRVYFLAILGTSLKMGLAESITFFYSEGIYSPNDTTQDYVFYDGHWETIPIPSLEGICDPGKKKYYLISVGFEGVKTMRVIRREDPDRISILFPEPGVLPDYVEIARKANRELVSEFRVPETQIVKAAAGDAIGAWRELERASVEKVQEENTYYLCSGTKPHALALGLRALVLEYPTVLYNVPDEHKIIDTRPSGTYWRYDIKDLASIS